MYSVRILLLSVITVVNCGCYDEYTVEHDGFKYTKQHPIVFIGGYPRSGTTLMRVLIEMNKNVRCGPETHIIPRMLSRWDITRGTKRMNDSGITTDLYDQVSSEFVLNIVAKHDHGAKILCNKDPFTLRYMETLTREKMFPNARFVLMIRDPRAIANSLRKRKITIANRDENSNNYEKKNCIMIRYEDLVEHTERVMIRVMKFIGEDYTPAMLNHTQSMSAVTLAPNEPSTGQVTQPIYKSAVYEWHKSINMTSSDYGIVKALKALENMETWKMLKKRYVGYRRPVPGYGNRFRPTSRATSSHVTT